MKRYLLLLLLVPSVCYGQYNQERTTEQSFEQSGLYFKSHFLNTHGLLRFRDVAVGLIDDPFLDLHLNPANLPKISGANTLLYFDFRGDRTEAEIITRYYAVPYDYMIYRPDRRWHSVTRQEPEPIFSLGLLAYPFRDKLEKLFVGGTYQIIYKEEPYYTVPIWIYDPRFGYDAFGEKSDPEVDNIPVQERYYGEDELSTQAHLFSAFAGYPLSERADLGISFNTVSHSRDGGYINSRADEYGKTNDWDYRTYEERARDQEYNHFDINGGLRYAVSRDFTAGIKVGYLTGEADQSSHVVDSSMHARDDSLHQANWYYRYSRSVTDKQWNRDGQTWYTRLNFDHQLERGKRVSAYYRYSKSDVDLQNSSQISKSSDHASRSIYRDTEYRSHGGSFTSDERAGTGNGEQRMHQAMVNLKWKLNRKSRVSLALFFSHNKNDLTSSEPVMADRWSDYHYTRKDTTTYTYNYYHRLIEVKRLQWQYHSTYWTVQIPVLLRHRFNRQFSLSLGVNRILKHWKISEQTTAYFTRRERTDNGDTKVETDFAERYTMPDKKFTEDYTAILASFEVAVSEEFKIRLMLDPETEGDLKINQWWLTFQLKM